MAAQVQPRGALIAIDGTRGKDLRAAAAALFEALKARHGECPISRFDASGLFGELAAKMIPHFPPPSIPWWAVAGATGFSAMVGMLFGIHLSTSSTAFSASAAWFPAIRLQVEQP